MMSLGRVLLLLPTILLLATCALPTNKQNAGERCESNDQCDSGYCNRGLCAGDSCDCGTTILDTCSSSGESSPDCYAGWVCAGSLEKLYTGGRCLPSCGSELCPEDYECHDKLCVRPPPPPPKITATAVPDEVEDGNAVTLTAEATSENGAIVEYQWAVSEEPGAVVVHVFDEIGLHQVGVRVTDEAGKMASTSVAVRVCQPDGGGCYYDPSRQQGICCTGSRCTKPADDGPTTCQPDE